MSNPSVVTSRPHLRPCAGHYFRRLDGLWTCLNCGTTRTFCTVDGRPAHVDVQATP